MPLTVEYVKLKISLTILLPSNVEGFYQSYRIQDNIKDDGCMIQASLAIHQRAMILYHHLFPFLFPLKATISVSLSVLHPSLWLHIFPLLHYLFFLFLSLPTITYRTQPYEGALL